MDWFSIGRCRDISVFISVSVFYTILGIVHLPEAMAPAVSPRANNRLGEVHSLEPYTTPRKHTTKGFITYEIGFFYFTPRLTDRKKLRTLSRPRVSAVHEHCFYKLFFRVPYTLILFFFSSSSFISRFCSLYTVHTRVYMHIHT